MDALPTTHADVLRADLRTVDEKIKAGVTLQRSKAQDKHWERWDEFCLESGIDPFLRTWDDPVPILQVFGQRYRDGRIAPRHNAVRARTVEDALRAIGQAFARVGSPDVRKNVYGDIDFRIQRQIRAYKREDSPPKRVKPIPIVIILYILAQAYGITRHEDTQAIADMITIAFFFLLRPGEYTGTTSDDTPFRLQDVHLYIGPGASTPFCAVTQRSKAPPRSLTLSPRRKMEYATRKSSMASVAQACAAPSGQQVGASGTCADITLSVRSRSRPSMSETGEQQSRRSR
jgi:hypothetical protein